MNKKILLTIAFFILFPTITHAYVDYYRDYKIFQSGLSPLTIEAEKRGEEDYRFFKIKGAGFENIKINENWTKVVLEKDSAKIYIYKWPNWNSFKFWKMTGTIGDKPFTITGFTIEGNLLENRIVFYPLFILTVLAVAFIIYKKRKKRIK